jgi:hypothetical protein
MAADNFALEDAAGLETVRPSSTAAKVDVPAEIGWEDPVNDHGKPSRVVDATVRFESSRLQGGASKVWKADPHCHRQHQHKPQLARRLQTRIHRSTPFQPPIQTRDPLLMPILLARLDLQRDPFSRPKNPARKIPPEKPRPKNPAWRNLAGRSRRGRIARLER